MLFRLRLLCLPLLVLAACGGSDTTEEAPQGLLVIAIDGLRADHLDLFEYQRETAPTLTELAKDGLTVLEAYSASPRRLPSHAALLTGCDPLPVQRLVPTGIDKSLLGDLAWSWSIPDVYPSVAVEFLANGWETAGFFDHANLSPVRGFRRGFAHFGTTTDEGPIYEPDDAGLHALSGQFLQWLRSIESNSSWFAYVQLDDLERCWSLPSYQWERYFRTEDSGGTVPAVGNGNEVFHAIPRNRWRGVPLSIEEYIAFYDGHLRRLDNEVRRLMSGLDLEGVDENTTVVIVGSTGVQFGEAGRILASGCYSMADLHVPWIVRPSKQLKEAMLAKGTKLDSLTSNIDLAPTLLDLAGLEIPHAMHGKSQWPVWRGETDAARTECFACLGLLGGWSAIGEDWVLEHLDIDNLVDSGLQRGWAGGIQQGEPAWRAYERSAVRFPELSYRDAPLEQPDVADLRREAEAWYGRLGLVREVLRGSWIQGQTTESTMKMLVDEGWIQASLTE